MVYKGVIFINDLLLPCSNAVRHYRRDSDLLSILLTKVKYVIDRAQTDRLKVVFTGQVFSDGVDMEAINRWLTVIKPVTCLILINPVDYEGDVQTALGRFLEHVPFVVTALKHGPVDHFKLDVEDELLSAVVFWRDGTTQLDVNPGIADDVALTETVLLVSDRHDTVYKLEGNVLGHVVVKTSCHSDNNEIIQLSPFTRINHESPLPTWTQWSVINQWSMHHVPCSPDPVFMTECHSTVDIEYQAFLSVSRLTHSVEKLRRCIGESNEGASEKLREKVDDFLSES